MRDTGRRGVAFRILVIGLSLTACSVQGPAADSSTEPSPSHIATDPPTVSRPPTATPSPVPTAPSSEPASPAAPASELPSPTAYARPVIPYPDQERPALQYPDLESYGAARVTLTSPDQPAITGAMSCLWEPGGEFSEPSVVVLQNFSIMLAGERVEIWLESYEFTIHRHGAASYVAGPGTGSVENVDIAEDGSSGTTRFDGLAPNPETAGSPSIKLADWIRPLGGNPAMARLTGTVEWACEQPPPTLHSELGGGCSASGGSSLICLDAPGPIVLVVDDRRQVGVNACGGFFGDICGPPLEPLPAENIVRVPTGGLLRFELPDERSHFLRWSLSWAAQSDAERWQTQFESSVDGPDFEVAFQLIDEGGPSEGSVLEFRAPPPGDWSVQLYREDDRDDEAASTTSFFRVVVGD